MAIDTNKIFNDMAKHQKHYISELDRFLKEFDQQHPELSESQRNEIKKHQKIAYLRDNKTLTEDSNSSG